MWNKSQTAAHNLSLSKWSNTIALVSNLRLNCFFAKDLVPTYLVPICENKVYCFCCSRTGITSFAIFFFHYDFSPDMGSFYKFESWLLTSSPPGGISSRKVSPCKAGPTWSVGIFYYTWRPLLAFDLLYSFAPQCFYSQSFSSTFAMLFISCSPGFPCLEILQRRELLWLWKRQFPTALGRISIPQIYGYALALSQKVIISKEFELCSKCTARA